MTVTPQTAISVKGLRILRIFKVCKKTGLSKATVYRKFGHLRIKLGANSSGWLEHEIDAEIEKLVAASRADAKTSE